MPPTTFPTRWTARLLFASLKRCKGLVASSRFLVRPTPTNPKTRDTGLPTDPVLWRAPDQRALLARKRRSDDRPSVPMG
jgi:hypothetical protein